MAEETARRLAQAVQRRKELEARLTELQVELAGARAEEYEWRRRADNGHAAPSGSRTERVHAVLRAADRALSPSDIVDAIGGDDDARSIRGTLAHLKREGRATAVSRGKWVAL